PIASREHLLDMMSESGAPATREELERILKLRHEDDKEALRRRLQAMVRDGQLLKNRRGAFVIVDEQDLVRGRVIAHPNGFGFLKPDEGGEDLYLAPRDMRAVLHGDRAVVRVAGIDRRGRREGVLVEVLERANLSIVGRLVLENGVSFVVPDNKRINQDVMIAPSDMGGARPNQIVVAEVTQQPSRRSPPVGKVTRVLGEHLTAGMEIDVALHAHGIPFEWPKAVREQVSGIGAEVREKDKAGRFDMRDKPLVTIDGIDAKDFDDAVYCEKRRNGWRLFVAIADVAHYVQPGSALDDEAQQRGTSVYFPGRVVPMLPEALSNGLCSLNPDVDRLCMICEMTVDTNGRIVRSKFHNGLMRSHARLTYDQVAAMLYEGDKALAEQHRQLLPHLQVLDELFQVLMKSRRQRGAMEFEGRETRIEFNADRKIDAIVPLVRNDAHKLIEECMILANIAAARALGRKKMPSLYRVHEGPEPEKLDELRSYLGLRGLSLGGGAKPRAKDLAKVLKAIEDREDAAQIQVVLLRSLKQAVYQPDNEGHFGLALEEYAHFTSPIRRYPDLLVHRGLKQILASAGVKNMLSGSAAKNFRYSVNDMVLLGQQCSNAERRADEATRDVTNWLKCEYMSDRVGEEFDGVVSAVTSFGLFVDLTAVYVEGLVHISNLPNDYYNYDPVSQQLVGKGHGVSYSMGTKMRVKVARVDLDERKIDLDLVAPSQPKKQAKSKNKRKRR
ncbi:MAG: ribonuclease R, partial [Granulosicoccaceae bacterium]